MTLIHRTLPRSLRSITTFFAALAALLVTSSVARANLLLADGKLGNFVWHDINGNGIQDPGEPGIEGVTVKIYSPWGFDPDWDTLIPKTVVTDASGFYEFTELSWGVDYIVEVDLSSPALQGFLPTTSKAGGDPQLDSNPTSTTANLDFDWDLEKTIPDLSIDFGFVRKPGEGKIGNFVWFDANQNGIQDTGEAGIAGVTVKLKDSTNNVIATAVTDGSGAYLFTGLYQGSYSVEVDASSAPLLNLMATMSMVGDVATDSNGIPAAVLLATDTSEDLTIDFGYIPMPAGSIGDLVWNDANGNGIQDGGEGGIGGVQVQLFSGSNLLGTVTTDPSGFYLFSGLGAGTYTIVIDNSQAALSGLAPTLTGAGTTANDSNVNPAVVVLATNGASDLTVDFGYKRLPGLGVIGDRVWKDLNQDGVQDAGEPGISGVTVTLKDDGNNLVATTTTDASGLYQFTGLYAGSYSVEIDAASPALANLIPTTPNAGGSAVDSNVSPAAVTLNTDSSVDMSIDFGYIPALAGSIGDYVWRDANGNGVQDSGESGIEGVEVQLYSGSALLATATTDANGHYLFSGLSAGTYKIVVDNSQVELTGLAPTISGAGSAATDSNVNPATVTLATNDASDLSIDFGYKRLPGLGMIGDKVWKDLNQDGVQDAGEPGIAGVTVTLKDHTNAVIATTTTDASGFYKFTGLYAGAYTVEVVGTSPALAGLMPTASNAGGALGAATDSNGSPAAVLLATDSSVDLTIDFGYYSTPAGSIGDFVWKDVNGNGIQDAGEPGIDSVTVQLYSGTTFLASVTTDPTGFYLFTGLGAGTYSVVVNNSQSALTGLTPTVTGAGTAANDSNVNPAVVTLATNSSSNTTIDFGYKAIPSLSYGTFTQGGWGAAPNGNNPGTLLASKFALVYPSGVTIGGTYTLTFTSAAAIEAFLPQGGTAAKLTSSQVNPSKKINVFAGQTLALKLNVDFSAAGLTGGGIGGLKVVSGKLAGWTVTQVLALCNKVLGGGATNYLPAGVTISDLNDIATAINENFDNGTTNNHYLQ